MSLSHGVQSVGLRCRLTVWHYKSYLHHGRAEPADCESSQFFLFCLFFIVTSYLFRALCGLVVGSSPHLVATTEAVLGICVVGGESCQDRISFFLFYSAPLGDYTPVCCSPPGEPVTVCCGRTDGYGRHFKETDQYILFQRLTGQARELAQRLPCKFMNK